MKKGILLHEASDDVGVAAIDIQKGEELEAVTLEGKSVCFIKVNEDIPLGHKIAMRELNDGKHIQEYGRTIGAAVKDIRMGDHVHVHNIKSLRWSASKSKVLVE